MATDDGVEITLPVTIRVGSGEERCIGEVTADTAADTVRMVASLLRTAADEFDRLAD